jgi:hypothetical protein
MDSVAGGREPAQRTGWGLPQQALSGAGPVRQPDRATAAPDVPAAPAAPDEYLATLLDEIHSATPAERDRMLRQVVHGLTQVPPTGVHLGALLNGEGRKPVGSASNRYGVQAGWHQVVPAARFDPAVRHRPGAAPLATREDWIARFAAAALSEIPERLARLRVTAQYAIQDILGERFYGVHAVPEGASWEAFAVARAIRAEIARYHPVEALQRQPGVDFAGFERHIRHGLMNAPALARRDLNAGLAENGLSDAFLATWRIEVGQAAAAWLPPEHERYREGLAAHVAKTLEGIGSPAGPVVPPEHLGEHVADPFRTLLDEATARDVGLFVDLAVRNLAAAAPEDLAVPPATGPAADSAVGMLLERLRQDRDRLLDEVAERPYIAPSLAQHHGGAVELSDLRVLHGQCDDADQRILMSQNDFLEALAEVLEAAGREAQPDRLGPRPERRLAFRAVQMHAAELLREHAYVMLRQPARWAPVGGSYVPSSFAPAGAVAIRAQLNALMGGWERTTLLAMRDAALARGAELSVEAAQLSRHGRTAERPALVETMQDLLGIALLADVLTEPYRDPAAGTRSAGRSVLPHQARPADALARPDWPAMPDIGPHLRLAATRSLFVSHGAAMEVFLAISEEVRALRDGGYPLPASLYPVVETADAAGKQLQAAHAFYEQARAALWFTAAPRSAPLPAQVSWGSISPITAARDLLHQGDEALLRGAQGLFSLSYVNNRLLVEIPQYDRELQMRGAAGALLSKFPGAIDLAWLPHPDNAPVADAMLRVMTYGAPAHPMEEAGLERIRSMLFGSQADQLFFLAETPAWLLPSRATPSTAA